MKPKMLLLVALLVGVLIIGVIPVTAQENITYTVEADDRANGLTGIARQFCTSAFEIYVLNRETIGANPNVIITGQELTVPDRCDTDTDPITPGEGAYDRGINVNATGNISGNVYTVAQGDFLGRIALRFGVSLSELAAANGITNPNRINAFARFFIPEVAGPLPTSPTDTDGDGIENGVDACPDRFSQFDNGCPSDNAVSPAPVNPPVFPTQPPVTTPSPTDSDGDGIADGSDQCPQQFGIAANNGCPATIVDTDNDGLADNLDICPFQPGPVSNDGCPTG